MSKEPKKNQYVAEVNRIFQGRSILEKYRSLPKNRITSENGENENTDGEKPNRIINNRRISNLNSQKRRRRSFIFPSIICLAFLIPFFLTYFIFDIKSHWLFVLPIVGLLSFFLFGCVFLDNNFLANMWLDGIELAVDIGIEHMLLLFPVIFIVMFIISTSFCLLFGIFVYPFAIFKNKKEIERERSWYE